VEIRGGIVAFDSTPALHEAAASAFASAAGDAVRARGVFRVALAGGNTPRGVYALLARDFRARVPWERVQFFWGDERHVPPDHPDSNFRMAQEAMLAPLQIDPRQVWRMKGEISNAAAAAVEYESNLRQVFAAPPPDVPRFDLVLLGLGPDGHTASLFPHTAALAERERLVAANHVPQLATDRITLTVPVLNSAARVVFLVAGADKADALKAVVEGAPDSEQFPAQLIQPSSGQLRWLVDRAAAKLLRAT
jgi:6-phosphogluconolactonase